VDIEHGASPFGTEKQAAYLVGASGSDPHRTQRRSPPPGQCQPDHFQGRRLDLPDRLPADPALLCQIFKRPRSLHMPALDNAAAPVIEAGERFGDQPTIAGCQSPAMTASPGEGRGGDGSSISSAPVIFAPSRPLPSGASTEIMVPAGQAAATSNTSRLSAARHPSSHPGTRTVARAAAARP
jgi:hypothetical protein